MTPAEFAAEVRRVLPAAVFNDSDVTVIGNRQWRLHLGVLRIMYVGTLGYGWNVWPGYTVRTFPAALQSARQRSEVQRDAANVVIAALDGLKA